jgi:hypothetical protein
MIKKYVGKCAYSRLHKKCHVKGPEIEQILENLITLEARNDRSKVEEKNKKLDTKYIIFTFKCVLTYRVGDAEKGYL